MPPSITSFATGQLALLEQERLAEVEETQLLLSQTAPKTLERAGLAILNLSVAAQRTGLGGKTVLELELDGAVKGATADLPPHGIRSGDIVAVADQPRGAERKKEKVELRKKGVEGVVLKVKSASVEVALDREDEEVPNGKLWMCVYIRCRLEFTADEYVVLSSRMTLHSRGASENLPLFAIEIDTKTTQDEPDHDNTFETIRVGIHTPHACPVRSRLASARSKRFKRAEGVVRPEPK
jgi:hypothetical protein